MWDRSFPAVYSCSLQHSHLGYQGQVHCILAALDKDITQSDSMLSLFSNKPVVITGITSVPYQRSYFKPQKYFKTWQTQFQFFLYKWIMHFHFHFMSLTKLSLNFPKNSEECISSIYFSVQLGLYFPHANDSILLKKKKQQNTFDRELSQQKEAVVLETQTLQTGHL